MDSSHFHSSSYLFSYKGKDTKMYYARSKTISSTISVIGVSLDEGKQDGRIFFHQLYLVFIERFIDHSNMSSIILHFSHSFDVMLTKLEIKPTG